MRALALTVAVVAVSAAPAAARADGEHEVTFRTPSGNIQCDGWSLGQSIADNTVVCAVMSTKVKVTYQCPDVGFGCPQTFTLNATGAVSVDRASYQVGASRTLAYGRSLTLGHVRCVSRMDGLTCTSLRSGHGFSLSRQKLSTW
jgi:hypothetical protein